MPAPAVIAEKLNVFAGNPLQGAFFALALVVALLRFRTLPARGRFIVVSAMGTWLVFNVAVQ